MRAHKRIDICCRYTIAWCLGLYFSLAAQARLPDDMHELAVASITSVYTEQFRQAKVYARRLIKNHSHHPAGYFFYAAILNSHMEFLQSEKLEAEFYFNCDNAIIKGEELLEKEPGNVWARFFIAGANGLKGTYESRYQRWLTAFKNGWRGVVQFKGILETNPEIVDAEYGIATYDYWRSAKTKMMWWLPGVEDRREPAMQSLYELLTKATYVRESAALNLIDMLLNEERFGDALQIANKLLTQYPSNLVVMWRKAEAQIGMRELDEAEVTVKGIRKRLESEAFESNYNHVLCHYLLAKIYFYRKRYAQCVKECDAMKTFTLSTVSEKRLEKIIADAALMHRDALKKPAQ